ncbi:MAG TPA: type II secretion system protein GspE [Gammaproteobacteria bacterium]|nr:type II secretion system protein GspE [Gammaproteobacteria bacterium]
MSIPLSDQDNSQDNPLVDLLDADVVEPDTRKNVTFAFAKRHQVLIAGLQDDYCQVYCGPNVRSQSLSEIRRFLRRPFKLHPCKTEEFNRRLQESYEQGSNEAMQMADELGDELDLFSVAQELAEPEDLLEAADDAPIIRLINALLTEAIKEGASDIHIEPFENRLVVRLRVDGILRQILEQQKAITSLIVSRIKVMAKLDIAEKRVPQDGRISLRIAGRSVDVRVSTLPAGHGERVVLRLLDKQAGRIDLAQLGMARPSFEMMNEMIKKAHGIILVTGPTGSGKTTSLYAVLTRLNDRQRNIMTVEDPIEYYLDGVGQTAVNTKVDMTFAKGLRAILRQDPDVVMIGEIRDLETAEISVQASLTGHLVLSTLHTNTAVGAVTRLRDMGVEPFLLSSSLVGVVAQRLVRVLCPKCKKPTQATERDCELLGVSTENPPIIFQRQGCEACNHLGYRGRTGIYEVIDVDDQLRTMIHEGAGEHLLEQYARTRTPGIRADGARRVIAGDTSLEEVMRVTQEG